MGILDITNRTENWKTASSFAPFFANPVACQNLARKLLEPLGEPLGNGEVQIELFWQGVRDQMDKEGWTKLVPGEKAEIMAGFADHYNRRFPELRQAFESFSGLALPQEWNYRPVGTDRERERLFDTLWSTEIDIVLETPGHLFIGEAKHKSRFGSSGALILVHQLPRQYVMATILTHYIGKSKEIVPFVVGDDPQNLKSNHEQVKFMLEQGWLKETNILSWDAIAALKGRSA